MYIENHVIKNFRNIEHIEIEPVNGINVIYGENGHGKTNIIESIWLFTGCRSFRSVRDKDVVRFDCDEAKLKMEFFSGNRNKEAEIRIDEKRHITLNGIALPSGRKMGQKCCRRWRSFCRGARNCPRCWGSWLCTA